MNTTKRKIISAAVVFILLLSITGCGFVNKSELKTDADNSNKSGETADIKEEANKTMQININGTDYIIKLEDNATVRALQGELPTECDMKELNGNEKYVYLNCSLPTAPSKPNRINAGDVMLFGDNCLVIFYKSFKTSYSYTKIGHIDNLPDLGKDDIKVKFYKETQ
ncbi:MAG: hypothetical protein K2G60_07095 [Oscillospiraceae bacterium]|nr:hypothetical protein [Oscillospiraceae bacterium]